MKEDLGVLEEKYRLHYQTWDVRITMFGMFLLQIPNIGLIYSDVLFFQSASWFLPVVTLRLSSFAIACVLILTLRAARHPARVDSMGSLFTAVLFICLGSIQLLRPELFLTQFGLDMLAILGCYLFFPNALWQRMTPALLFSAFLGYCMFWLEPEISSYRQIILLMSVFLVNIMGLFISNQFQYFRRKRFVSMSRLLAIQKELKTLANTDSLTGIANRRHFMDEAEKAWDSFVIREMPFTLMFIDLDYFKTINDNYGHGTGDQVLIEFVAEIKKFLRGNDLIGRLGGEEFGILLPGISLCNAEKIGHRLRQAAKDLRIEVDNNLVGFSISIGIAEAEKGYQSLTEMLNHADKALYRAKHLGRDQVCVSQVEQLRLEPKPG